jgi:tetratricopeptide (TPR) repeat protein
LLVVRQWEAPGLPELVDGFIEQNPRYVDLIYRRGWIAGERGDMAKACESFRAAADLGDAMAQMVMGKHLFLGRCGPPNREEGLSLLRAAAAQGQWDAQYSLAEALELMGHAEQAAAARARFEQLRRAKHARPHLDRAKTHLRAEAFDEAIAAYTEALQVDPQNAVTLADRGLAFYAMGDLRSALSDYDQAIAIDPGLETARLRRGIAYGEGAGQLDRAIADFTRAIEISPQSIDAHLARGFMYAAMRKWDEAIGDYGRVIEAHPWVRQAYLPRAASYYFKGEYEKAWQDVQALQERGGEAPPEFVAALDAKRGKSRPSITQPMEATEAAFQSLFEAMDETRR